LSSGKDGRWPVASAVKGLGGARCSGAPVVPALGEEVEEERGNGVLPMPASWCSEKLEVELSACTVVAMETPPWRTGMRCLYNGSARSRRTAKEGGDEGEAGGGVLEGRKGLAGGEFELEARWRHWHCGTPMSNSGQGRGSQKGWSGEV